MCSFFVLAELFFQASAKFFFFSFPLFWWPWFSERNKEIQSLSYGINNQEQSSQARHDCTLAKDFMGFLNCADSV